MGVSVNVLWVTSQWPYGEHVHHFKCFLYYNTWSKWSWIS